MARQSDSLTGGAIGFILFFGLICAFWHVFLLIGLIAFLIFVVTQVVKASKRAAVERRNDFIRRLNAGTPDPVTSEERKFFVEDILPQLMDQGVDDAVEPQSLRVRVTTLRVKCSKGEIDLLEDDLAMIEALISQAETGMRDLQSRIVGVVERADVRVSTLNALVRELDRQLAGKEQIFRDIEAMLCRMDQGVCDMIEARDQAIIAQELGGSNGVAVEDNGLALKAELSEMRSRLENAVMAMRQSFAEVS